MQLLCNMKIDLGLVNSAKSFCLPVSNTDIKSFAKDLKTKLFNTRCKAFLKSIELLEEEKQGKALDRDVMLRQKLKVDKKG